MFQKLKKCIMVAVTGIVLTASVTAGALAANVTATTSVNVRAGAGNGYKVVTVLKKGQVVAKTGSSGNWTKVTANGKTGYVYNKYLTSGGSTTTNASKKPSASTSSTGSKTYMGNYKLTFYAGDSTTASGRTPRVNHTIAADTSILPMYSTLKAGAPTRSRIAAAPSRASASTSSLPTTKSPTSTASSMQMYIL